MELQERKTHITKLYYNKFLIIKLSDISLCQILSD